MVREGQGYPCFQHGMMMMMNDISTPYGSCNTKIRFIRKSLFILITNHLVFEDACVCLCVCARACMRARVRVCV